MSPLLDDMYNETAPASSFQVAGTSYRNEYYLVDEIYPERACFVKSLSCPNDCKRLKFMRAQEKARKDVERTFGALKKHEENAICEYNENEIIPPTQAFEVGSAKYMSRRAIVHDVETHHVLRRDLTEHIWNGNHINLKWNRSTIWKVNFPIKMFFRSI
ncbi:unnamed protein product [Lactuca virosa]|uniref:DDE Tnp4 domain-containing protein n=1 Tax=Lactuca virosa TaxID=75947 RepID=A0AAU9N216_9ASTR|nr:unnamed protein product [Lactuca virosa]